MQAYSLAVDEQEGMLKHVRRITSTPIGGPGVFQKEHLYKGVLDQYQPALRRMTHCLETAVPIWWDNDLCSVLEAAAPTMPDWELTLDRLPAKSGFIHFGRALYLPMPDERVIKRAIADGKRRADLPLDYRLDVTGLAWNIYDPEDVFIATFLRTSNRVGGEPGLMHVTREGASMTEIIGHLADTKRNESIWEDTDHDVPHEELMRRRAELQVRYIAAALDFMNQPLLTTRTRHSPDRATRKRAEREGRVVQDVQVIELRRKQYLTLDEPDEAPAEREYRHRWFVGMATGGYWQRYHTRDQGTIRRLILPYMKLADRTDLPIKQPRQTVIVVDR